MSAHSRISVLSAGLAALTGLAFQPDGTAAVFEAWVQRSGHTVSNSADKTYSVVCDAAGDIIVAGEANSYIQSKDMLIIKYSGADGTVLWKRLYIGPGHNVDVAVGIAVDVARNVFVTGYSYSGTSFDYYTAKYAATDGAVLWEKRYDGLGNSDDRPSGIAVDASGDVVVTGNSNNDYLALKYRGADGGLLWETRYNGALNGVAVDSNDDVVVTGYSNTDIYTAKYNGADGSLLWEKHYRSPVDNSIRVAVRMALDQSDNVIVSGSSANSIVNPDCYTAKYAAADGSLLWERTYNGGDDDFTQGVKVDSSGNVILAGYGLYAKPGRADYDYYTAKYSSTNGAVLWERIYDRGSRENPLAVALDAADNVIVLGSYLVKYASADGAILWESDFQFEGVPHSIVVDASENAFVTGFTDNVINPDSVTVKFACSNAAVLWATRYTGIANTWDHARAAAVDAFGNAFVTGYTVREAQSAIGTVYRYDYHTAKYASASGQLLWEQFYSGAAGDHDYAHAIALDPFGNAVVTGGAILNGDRADYYTAKYAATNGALIWERSYSASAIAIDEARAVAVDSAGNVAVTGTSFGGTQFSGSYDIYTASYHHADGTLRWEKRRRGCRGGRFRQCGDYRCLLQFRYLSGLLHSEVRC
jgi:hypothetical protein